jgi:hypothetical protein
MNMGKIVNALKWMKISVLNRAEKNPKFKPFKIFRYGYFESAMVLRLQETALSWWKYVSKLSSDAK